MTAAATDVRMQWGIRIPLRDGVRLHATLYLPEGNHPPSPVLFTLTPYTAQTYHERGLYFAERGFSFLTVDSRGRGNSEGEFRPFIQEAKDGYDVVEWLAGQPYCNGQVAMWGGSYGGYAQWATAKEFPPHLATIVPVASVCPGLDYPMRNNIVSASCVQWLILTAGRTSQENMLSGSAYWHRRLDAFTESGAAFKTLDAFLGIASETFQEWLAHPQRDLYWDGHNPTAEQFAALGIPILTITGMYDDDQPGALEFYREHMKSASVADRPVHFLIIGPWDHAGTRTPQLDCCGLRFGPASLVDLPKLHAEWYAWTMQGRPRPAFLQAPVAYYVSGTEKWRYADSLGAITRYSQVLSLDSERNPTDVLASGSLRHETATGESPDTFIYDPKARQLATLEAQIDPENRLDQRLIYAALRSQLVYHSEPFAQDVEISGFFRLSVWIAIDRPDTDFRVSVYEVALDGTAIGLTADTLRARYRESLREAKPIETEDPLHYEFERFPFVSRCVRTGHRLRLVIGPVNSIHAQRNANRGGVVAEESTHDALPVVVRVFHDPRHPSVLHVPLGCPENDVGGESTIDRQ